MPDQDGYSVCTQIKQHAQFGHIPVVLMSGVVNKTVADKAVSVRADELIRKPFQPQELIGRVKALLNPKPASPAPYTTDRPSAPSIPGIHNMPGVPNISHAPSAANSLSSLFAPATPPPPGPTHAAPQPHASEQRVPESAWPRALAEAFTPHPTSPASIAPQNFPPVQQHANQPIHAGQPAQPPVHPPARAVPSGDAQKLRAEVARLELLVKKLQTELQIERQYNQALESQIHDLTHTE
jgi:CheY-like chemotaxis protein